MNGFSWRACGPALLLVVSALGASMPGPSALGATLGGRTFSTPSLMETGGGVRVHGSICRTSTVTPGKLSGVRIEWVDATGKLIGVKVAHPSRDLSGREVGCAFYDQKTDWTPNEGDRVRVCAAEGSGCPAG